MEPLSQPLVHVDSWLSEDDERSLANDVLDGLTKPFKELASKHFYDARGSELFEQITEQPEYYPTRTELAILRDNAARDRVHDRRRGAGGAGSRRLRQGARAARRHARRGTRCGATSRSTSPRPSSRTPRGA